MFILLIYAILEINCKYISLNNNMYKWICILSVVIILTPNIHD